jgi:hypothetical protein
VRRPRFYVFSQGTREGQTFWILDRLNNHREVARFGPPGHYDPVRNAAMAMARCDQLNRGRP